MKGQVASVTVGPVVTVVEVVELESSLEHAANGARPTTAITEIAAQRRIDFWPDKNIFAPSITMTTAEAG